jgi:hypothetical protein
LAKSQIPKIFAFINEQIFHSSTSTESQKLRIPKNLRDESSVPTNSRIEPDLGKLLACVAIDTIGSSSILIPFIGDASDVLWAPTAGLLLRYLFYNSNVILLLEFAEEILPLTDILPLATLCWIVDTYFRDSSIAELLQLGDYSPAVTDRDRKDAIDVNSRDYRSKSDREF